MGYFQSTHNAFVFSKRVSIFFLLLDSSVCSHSCYPEKFSYTYTEHDHAELILRRFMKALKKTLML